MDSPHYGNGIDGLLALELMRMILVFAFSSLLTLFSFNNGDDHNGWKCKL
jgi:hypothetical protein